MMIIELKYQIFFFIIGDGDHGRLKLAAEKCFAIDLNTCGIP